MREPGKPYSSANAGAGEECPPVTEIANIVWGYGPMLLAVIAMLVAVEALRVARDTYLHLLEVEALVSRYRRAEASAAARFRGPEVG